MNDFDSSLSRALQFIEPFFDVRESRYSLSEEEKRLFGRAWNVLVPIDTGDEVEEIEVRLFFRRDFPLSLPNAFVSPALVRRLRYPLHVGVEGSVCTHDIVTTQTNVAAPGEVVEDVMRRLQRIITNGFRTLGSPRDYGDEYLAYWDQSFDHEPEVIHDCLSLLGGDDIGEARIYLGTLTPPFGRFTSLLYSEGQQKDKLFRELKSQGITVGKDDVWYAGEFEQIPPPLRLSNRKGVEMVERIDSLLDIGAFRRYLKRRRPVVVFRTTISGRSVYLGWVFHLPHRDRNHRKLTVYDRLIGPRGGDAVTRISPKDISLNRLVGRTTGPSSKIDERNIDIMIVGVGSVGSHLAHYMSSMPGTTVHLADPDKLQLENVGRHILGVGSAGQNKARAVASHIRRTSPLSDIGGVYDIGVFDLVLKEPEFIAGLDYLFVCIGEANTELWLDRLRREGRGPKKGVFYLWVEPLLAGGHCLFLPSDSDETLEGCFEDSNYRFNIISSFTYREKTFTVRERGCHTTYTPYAGSSVQLFVGGIMIQVMKILKSDRQDSVAMAWIGDVANAMEEGCELSPSVRNHSMGDLLIYPIGSEALV